MPAWYEIANPDDVASPALLVYPERVETNLRVMIETTGGAGRLFPHIKTHKLPEIVRMHQAHGIQKFKCATIAEAEMAADCGAQRVLLAYQPVGPNVARLIELITRFPQTKFGALVDNAASARALSTAAQARGVVVELLLDLNVGMNRTGIAPGPEAIEVYRLLATLPGISAGGLHAYDGHIHDLDAAERRTKTNTSFAEAEAFATQLKAQGLAVPRIVAGGTPTFPIHAREHAVECSPGTCVLMDMNSAEQMSGMGFVSAAVVLARVVSKPTPNRLCVDLGHKAIAAENPHPRVRFFGLEDAKAVMHSEEHLVLETPRAADFKVGDVLYGIPRHICPTVALHASVVVVRDGRAAERWKVVARDRVLSV